MKRSKVIIPVLVAFLSVLSCSELSKLTKFDIPIINSMDLPVLPIAVNDFQKSTDSISTNYQSSFNANSVTRDFVDKII